MGLVLVVRGPRDFGIRHQRGQLAGGTRPSQHLDVEIRERDDHPDAKALAQLAKGRHVRGLIDPRHRAAVIGGVLGGGQRVRVRRDDRRVLAERRHDVVALADTGQEDGYSVPCHPPVSPL